MKMKKLMFLLMLTFAIGMVARAQDDKDKTKPTSSIPQKMHNAVSEHKRHNGYKTKSDHNGVKHKHKVNTKTGEVQDKTDK